MEIISGVQVLYSDYHKKNMYRAAYYNNGSYVFKEWTENGIRALDDFIALREAEENKQKNNKGGNNG